MEKVFSAVSTVVMALAVTLLRFFVATKIWSLTMVKHLGAPEITVWQAVAVGFALSIFTQDFSVYEEERKRKAIPSLVSAALGSLIMWGLVALVF
jgi:hypothetical protein